MAYEFNGTNQYLSVPAPIDGLTKPFTLAAWFNPDNITTNGALIALSPANGNYWGVVALGANAGDPVAAIHSSNAAANTTSGFVANQWQHACAVFTNIDSRTAYLNGGNSGTSGAFESSPTAATELLIGNRRIAGALGAYMDGKIAEIGIWNAALTAAEVASLAKGMTCDKVRPQNLVFYAPLVRDLVDQKGGLAITNNNSATVANHPRVYA
jgi:hypothetical protein